MWSGALPEHQLAGLPALNSTLLTTSHKSLMSSGTVAIDSMYSLRLRQ
jgi:hypothetical protein